MENNLKKDMQEIQEQRDAVESTTNKSWKKEFLEWMLSFAKALVLVYVVYTFILAPVRVSGSSMANTLQNNDIMIATKFDYLLGNPSRFDIVICNYPNRKESFVKRIVGLPGDVVSIQDGLLSVNGKTYPENYITFRPNYFLSEYKVPDGEYFVLGDNRSNSNDSHTIGAIPRANITGHVRCVIYPFSHIRSVQLKDEEIQALED